MKKLFKTIGACTLLASASLAGSALAADVTLQGTNVRFIYDDALLGLFGAPAVSGNTLEFAPTGFSVESVAGAGYALTNSTVNVRIIADPGYQLSAVNLFESGAFALAGAGSFVEVTGQIRVFDLNDPIDNEVTSNIAATLGSAVWTANAGVTVPTVDWRSQGGVVSGLQLTIENLLIANTIATDSLASLQKNFISAGIVVSPVPEAHTYAMLLAGLGLVGFMARRRSANI